MTSSMTAFTRQQSEHDWGTLVWELRSVNHRYLEPNFRLPEALRGLEGRLRELLRGSLSRGKVEAGLRFSSSASASSPACLNEGLLRQLVEADRRIRAELDGAAPLDTLELMKWPGVLQEQEQDVSVIEAEALKLFEQSLHNLQQQRDREGAELEALIRQRLEAIGAIVAEIRAAMPEILRRQKERIRDLFEDMKLEADQSRLEQEIVLVVHKADINEELDRLDTHVKEVARVLSQQGQVGRRLDFLMQELNREANTICSKAIVTETTLGAVELKVLIEQMREQIQNIE